jgi:hypothetical protein
VGIIFDIYKKNRMKIPLTRFNTWYDSIEEPKRFLFFFFLLALPFIFAQADITTSTGIRIFPKWLDYIIIIAVVLLVFSRMALKLKNTK